VNTIQLRIAELKSQESRKTPQLFEEHLLDFFSDFFFSLPRLPKSFLLSNLGPTKDIATRLAISIIGREDA
jgi:hypothetical protein